MFQHTAKQVSEGTYKTQAVSYLHAGFGLQARGQNSALVGKWCAFSTVRVGAGGKYESISELNLETLLMHTLSFLLISMMQRTDMIPKSSTPGTTELQLLRNKDVSCGWLTWFFTYHTCDLKLG